MTANPPERRRGDGMSIKSHGIMDDSQFSNVVIQLTDHLIDDLLAEFQSVLAEAERKAVETELNRLDGALEIFDLHEEDLQKLKTWVNNAKWALIAPPGKNTQGQSTGGTEE